MNTIRHRQIDEPASYRRSLELCEEIDLWESATQSPIGGGGVVGGSRSGKEHAVNTGDLPGQDARETARPAGVRAAVIAQASRGQHPDGTTVTTERSRPIPGGAKGGREANPESNRPDEATSPRVPATDKQGEEDLWQHHKAERGVWSQGMLEALERGVKGGKWYSLIDKVYAERTLALGWEAEPAL
jgi:hypothetical protein